MVFIIISVVFETVCVPVTVTMPEVGVIHYRIWCHIQAHQYRFLLFFLVFLQYIELYNIHRLLLHYLEN